MKYDFLIETYDTERVKVISAWSMFRDDDLPVRPNATDGRGRSLHEHMVHQCVSEDSWFRTMLGIDVGAPPLPNEEVRLQFMWRYAEDSGKRLAVLRTKEEAWWEAETGFFDVRRSRAWVMTRRMMHTSHHRGPTTGAAQDPRAGGVQQLWPDGRHGRTGAESCSDDLCVSQSGGFV